MYNPPSSKPIGIVFPIQKGSSGYFNQSFDTISQTNASLINFLNTRRGERPMNPLFGSELYNYIFETEIDQKIVQQVLIEELSYWIPTMTNIRVDISQSNSDADNNIIYIRVNYSIVNTNLNSSVVIGVNYSTQ